MVLTILYFLFGGIIMCFIEIMIVGLIFVVTIAIIAHMPCDEECDLCNKKDEE
jgi:uncharacterized membrane protein YccF (DUF307 family)